MSEARKQGKPEQPDSHIIRSGTLDPFKWVTRVCGIVPACISLIALLGWQINILSLASLRTDYIPMAPSTAVLFVTMSVGLLICLYQPRRRFVLHLTRVGLIAVALLSGLMLIQFFAGG